MIRSLLTALLVGCGIAFGLLGAGVTPIAGLERPQRLEHPTQTAAPRSLVPHQPTKNTAVRSDQDSNTAERRLRLNPNIINGTTTIICTSEPALFTLLEDAIARWNLALSALSFGDDVRQSPLRLHKIESPEDSMSDATLCDDNSVPGGVDVVVMLGDCAGGTPTACFWSARDAITSARMAFRTPGRAGPDYENDNYATIIYEGSNITLNTLLHELGHVLGLQDYTDDNNTAEDEGCIALRNRTPDVDPLDNHFSLMRNRTSASCRTNGIITGRDLRDFYEAYRVGPITQVHPTGDITLAEGNLAATLYWGSAGQVQPWYVT